MPRTRITPETIEHGTRRGYRQHNELGVPPCEPCRVANRLYHKERYKPKGTPRRKLADPTPGERCGSMNGARDHNKRGERLCEECRVVYNADQRRRYQSQRNWCGTKKGLKVHQRQGEEPCGACVRFLKTGAEQRAEPKTANPRRLSHGACSCDYPKVRKEEDGLLQWICGGCEQVWHSQPAEQWPPPKLTERAVLAPAPGNGLKPLDYAAAAAKIDWDRVDASAERRRAYGGDCGTANGYARHRRAGETPCKACLAANADSTRKRKAEQRATL